MEKSEAGKGSLNISQSTVQCITHSGQRTVQQETADQHGKLLTLESTLLQLQIINSYQDKSTEIKLGFTKNMELCPNVPEFMDFVP